MVHASLDQKLSRVFEPFTNRGEFRRGGYISEGKALPCPIGSYHMYNEQTDSGFLDSGGPWTDTDECIPCEEQIGCYPVHASLNQDSECIYKKSIIGLDEEEPRGVLNCRAPNNTQDVWLFNRELSDEEINKEYYTINELSTLNEECTLNPGLCTSCEGYPDIYDEGECLRSGGIWEDRTINNLTVPRLNSQKCIPSKLGVGFTLTFINQILFEDIINIKEAIKFEFSGIHNTGQLEVISFQNNYINIKSMFSTVDIRDFFIQRLFTFNNDVITHNKRINIRGNHTIGNISNIIIMGLEQTDIEIMMASIVIEDIRESCNSTLNGETTNNDVINCSLQDNRCTVVNEGYECTYVPEQDALYELLQRVNDQVASTEEQNILENNIEQIQSAIADQLNIDVDLVSISNIVGGESSIISFTILPNIEGENLSEEEVQNAFSTTIPIGETFLKRAIEPEEIQLETIDFGALVPSQSNIWLERNFLDQDCNGIWSECTISPSGCQKEYIIQNHAVGSGRECIIEEGETIQCSPGDGSCPRDCLFSWSECDNDCRRDLFILETEMNGGAPCPDPVRYPPCDPGEDDCPPDIDCIGEWIDGDGSECIGEDGSAVTCGGGNINQVYNISVHQSGNGNACSNEDGAVRVHECNTHVCPVDCVGEWGQWSDCNKECIGPDGELPEISRNFIVTTPKEGSGNDCIDPNTSQLINDGEQQIEFCNLTPCPINCEGEWGDWSECSQPECGGGTQTRTYNVSVASNHGGRQCLSGSSEWNTEWYPGNINPAQVSSIFEEHRGKYLPNAGEMDGLMGGPPDERSDHKYTLDEAYNLCYDNDDCGGFHVHKNYFGNWGEWEHTHFISRNNITVMYDDSWDNNRNRGERYNSYVKKDAGGFGQISRPTGIPEGVDVNSVNEQPTGLTFFNPGLTKGFNPNMYVQERQCNMQLCPEDCDEGWGPSSGCLVSLGADDLGPGSTENKYSPGNYCGKGRVSREWNINSYPRYGGEECVSPSPTIDSMLCDLPDTCPVDCVTGFIDQDPVECTRSNITESLLAPAFGIDPQVEQVYKRCDGIKIFTKWDAVQSQSNGGRCPEGSYTPCSGRSDSQCEQYTLPSGHPDEGTAVEQVCYEKINGVLTDTICHRGNPCGGAGQPLRGECHIELPHYRYGQSGSNGPQDCNVLGGVFPGQYYNSNYSSNPSYSCDDINEDSARSRSYCEAGRNWNWGRESGNWVKIYTEDWAPGDYCKWEADTCVGLNQADRNCLIKGYNECENDGECMYDSLYGKCRPIQSDPHNCSGRDDWECEGDGECVYDWNTYNCLADPHNCTGRWTWNCENDGNCVVDWMGDCMPNPPSQSGGDEGSEEEDCLPEEEMNALLQSMREMEQSMGGNTLCTDDPYWVEVTSGYTCEDADGWCYPGYQMYNALGVRIDDACPDACNALGCN
tara:strand:- start:7820 stop:12103 length:4284 start_codon:yes stop_codon:yes gene_type:complete